METIGSNIIERQETNRPKLPDLFPLRGLEVKSSYCHPQLQFDKLIASPHGGGHSAGKKSLFDKPKVYIGNIVPKTSRVARQLHHFFIPCFLFLILYSLPLKSQNVYFSRYMGNNYLEDQVYRLEIFNPGTTPVSLSGYLLVSRQYVALLPEKAVVPSKGTLRLGKSGGPGGGPDIDFPSIGDFIIRIPKRSDPGDYVVLLDRQRNLVDAFYYSPQRKVGFLPDEGELITFQNKKIPFGIPAEGNIKWSYMQMSPDPAMAFVRINNQWRAVSRTKNTLPATAYADVKAKYVNGIVTVESKTAFERDCLEHQLERSENGITFYPITSLPSNENASATSSYLFYDDKLEQNRRYFYRFKNTDRFGHTVYSKLVEVRTEEAPNGFSMEVFLSRQGTAPSLNVRFSSREAQRIRIKLLDEQFREQDILFYDSLEGGSQYLIKYDGSMPIGKYYVIADTERRRFYEELIVRE